MSEYDRLKSEWDENFTSGVLGDCRDSFLLRVSRRLWNVNLKSLSKSILGRLAERGNRDAREILVDLTVDEKGSDQAADLLQKFALEGVPGAALHLADLLAESYGSREVAEKWYRAAMSEGDPAALNNFGCFLREDDARFAEAESTLLQAFQIGDPLASGNLARMYFDAGDFDKALPWFSKSVQLGVDSVLPVAARNLAALGRGKEAEEMIRDALSKEVPGATLAYAQILSASSEDGSLGNPEEWFREAVNESAPGVSFPFACWLESRGREEEAIAFYEASAREGEPNAHLNLAIIYERRDNFRLAEIHFQAGMASGDVKAAVTYAHFLAENDRQDDLGRVLEGARKMGASERDVSEIRDLMDF
ncbi:tetratricopeptide repeat protein [Streptomyces sp. NPDC058052]|uniref:tetratricopeptide repeat protein n=1 Tax=Streptomyces sp. NPDC058052 TaxID=3346316 RepID=UPI0036E26A56